MGNSDLAFFMTYNFELQEWQILRKKSCTQIDDTAPAPKEFPELAKSYRRLLQRSYLSGGLPKELKRQD